MLKGEKLMTSQGNQASRFRRRASLLAIFAAIAAAAGIVLSSGGNGPQARAPKDGGDARLVSFEPLPQTDGPECQFVPASTSSSLFAELREQQGGSEPTSAQGSAEQRPSDAAKAELSKRAPVRVMRDPSAAFSGVAPLLTMLNSCSANVVVVNIDSGFKGGYVAALIARRKVSRT